MNLKRIFKKKSKLDDKLKKSGAYQEGYLAGYHDGLMDALDKAEKLASNGKKNK